MSMSLRLRTASLVVLAAVGVTASSPLYAEGENDIQKLQQSLEKQQALVKKQQDILTEQRKKLASQETEISNQRKKLEDLIKRVDSSLKSAPETDTAASQATTEHLAALQSSEEMSEQEMKEAVGAGKPAVKKASLKSSAKTATEADKKAAVAPAATPILAPKKEEKRPEIAALPDAGGVLTPKGVLMYENTVEYVNTTSNVFTFSGVQVAEVVFIGVTNATTAKRQILQDSSRFRIGLTNRLEADVRIPYVYRNDTTTDTNAGTTTRTTIEGDGIGDIDAGLAYQINRGNEGWPFFVANMRYKANNAEGPFDVGYDADSIATELPTGTGFHSVEGSLTAIKVTDPAVLFSNLGYVHNIGSKIGKNFGDTRVIEVQPGDAVNASAGIGFSINPETSFTLGYKHSYVFATKQMNQEISSGEFSNSESDTASVGALLVGASYRFSPITSLNFNVEVGATREAPDVRVGIRIPVRLGSLF